MVKERIFKMESEGSIAQTGSPPEVEDITKNFIKTSTKDDPILRKVICRYGPGCTHILDVNHREKFWHPRLQKLNGQLYPIKPLFLRLYSFLFFLDEQIKSNFICNECGYATNSLPDLQVQYSRVIVSSLSQSAFTRVLY